MCLLRKENSPKWLCGTTRTALTTHWGRPRMEKNMAWAYVLIAGILEVVWSFSLKASDGFTKLLPSVATVFFMILSFVVLAQGMKSLPLGTAYAVWTGIGAVGAALVGIVVLGEAASLMRIAGIAFIVTGIVLLKLAAH